MGTRNGRVTRAESSAGNIAILGIGKEGQAAREYLRTRCPGIHLALLSEDPPDPAFAAVLDEQDELLTGPFAAAHLERFDLLVRSPGISLYRPALQRARSSGVEITTPSNLWFASHPQERTICVTGTKGKSTSSALIAHALRACGNEVRLAGNIGQPLLACDDRNVDWWVIELSSYQLADLVAEPTAGVILNLSTDHLDWHGSEQIYRQDKLRLAQLAANSILVSNADDQVLTDALSSKPGVVWFNDDSGIHVEHGRILDGSSLLPVRLHKSLPGAHNRSNTAAALTVLKAIGVDLEKAARSLSSFRGLPHRLQLIGERSGIRYINDSISSTPVATVAALEALFGQVITLIVGGLDRGLDWAPYMETFRSCTPGAVIALPGNGEQIIDTMRQGSVQPENGLHLVADLSEAVELAQKLTKAKGTVLLSPGAPSFPQFKDYRDRGQQFASLSGFKLEE